MVSATPGESVNMSFVGVYLGEYPVVCIALSGRASAIACAVYSVQASMRIHLVGTRADDEAVSSPALGWRPLCSRGLSAVPQHAGLWDCVRR